MLQNEKRKLAGPQFPHLYMEGQPPFAGRRQGSTWLIRGTQFPRVTLKPPQYSAAILKKHFNKKYYQLGISVFTSKYNRTDSRSSAHMVSKLTAREKHMFKAILGLKWTDKCYQLPTTIQPTKPQSRKITHQGEIQSHNFLSSVLNRCQTPGENEGLASSEHVQKKQTASRPPLATSRDR